MPVYEYECEKCGGRFEVTQKFSDPVLTDCNLCKSSGTVRKVLSPTAFVLKGSGWYATDYASKERKKDDSEKASKQEAKPAGCASGTCGAGGCSAKG